MVDLNDIYLLGVALGCVVCYALGLNGGLKR